MFGQKVEEVNTLKDRQLLEEKEHEMTLTMTGDSLESAVGNLFQMMRKQIFEEIGHPIIQMETRAVYFQSGSCFCLCPGKECILRLRQGSL